MHSHLEFKKQSDEEKLGAFKGLLKGSLHQLLLQANAQGTHTAYQSEIDNLTKRSKMAENSFLSVYKVLGGGILWRSKGLRMLIFQ